MYLISIYAYMYIPSGGFSKIPYHLLAPDDWSILHPECIKLCGWWVKTGRQPSFCPIIKDGNKTWVMKWRCMYIDVILMLGLYIFIHIYLYIYIYTYIFIHIYLYIYIFKHTVYIYTYIYIYTLLLLTFWNFRHRLVRYYCQKNNILHIEYWLLRIFQPAMLVH